MQNQINLVQGDTGPDLTIALFDAVANEPIDVSSPNTTVRLHVRSEDTGTVTTITATKDNGGADGIVSFAWPTGIFDNAGYYEAEVEMTMNTGKKQTVPDKIRIYARPQIA